MPSEKMNSVLEQALITIIEKSGSAIDASINFLSTEIPDVIRQLLVWKATEAGIYAVIGLIASIILCFVMKKGYDLIAKKREPFGALLILSSGSGMIISSVLFITNLFTMIQIMIAPKIYLIEYAATLLKK